jgi:CRP-like cAMP-binding protein
MLEAQGRLAELDRQIEDVAGRLESIRAVMERLIRDGRKYERTWQALRATMASLIRLRQAREQACSKHMGGKGQAISAGCHFPNAVVAAGRSVRIRAGSNLFDADTSCTNCYLVQSGLISLCRQCSHNRWVEVAMAGPGNFVGFWPLLGVERSPFSAVALTNCVVIQMPAAVVRPLCETDPSLQRVVLAQLFGRATELVILAACNAEHMLPQRLARWLLTASMRLGADNLQVTHRVLAFLMGVRRASVTLALHDLEGHRAIRTRRGRIVILDRPRLESCSCGCERVLNPDTG